MPSGVQTGAWLLPPLVAKGDSAWRAPMGTVVMGGLILSTLLTLLIVPAGFSLANGLEARLGPRLSRLFLTYKTGDNDGAALPVHEPLAGQARPPATPATRLGDGPLPAE